MSLYCWMWLITSFSPNFVWQSLFFPFFILPGCVWIRPLFLSYSFPGPSPLTWIPNHFQLVFSLSPTTVWPRPTMGAGLSFRCESEEAYFPLLLDIIDVAFSKSASFSLCLGDSGDFIYMVQHSLLSWYLRIINYSQWLTGIFIHLLLWISTW